jgi:hypothetical protein
MHLSGKEPVKKRVLPVASVQANPPRHVPRHRLGIRLLGEAEVLEDGRLLAPGLLATQPFHQVAQQLLPHTVQLAGLGFDSPFVTVYPKTRKSKLGW